LRHCRRCALAEVEDTAHVLLRCPTFAAERAQLVPGEVAALLGEVKELKAAVGALVTDAASARQDAIDDARLQRLIEARDARRI
jgi:hypothetical protein